ncbi:hypothetical protein BCR33DRAFT_779410 [Rhizoclosmatium globosum]|uniref:Extradiol ring-cleavage dioxygenase class III enzyme subunit B domain-containing protein n=1 Tax=Rhizoclosmatium globosum TaxID=329046 RepID=A0A1Y2D191_9FUNG|nr:hypothetical protein BCR33DRAFT_779410 [Rhizoclosmatium globosum]|eukprot:ORY53051.1 hypothetical protein BCR33DRAFT_779410 [Rhizoclosmatium globosum]
MIVSAAIIPHGTMVLDPNRANLPDGAAALNTACQAAARLVSESKPTTIVLITPHSLSLTHSTAVPLGPEAKGNAEWNGNWNEFEAHVAISPLSPNFVEFMRERGHPVEGLSAFSRMPCPLRWAECVPIHFLAKEPALATVPFLIISPSRGKSVSTNLEFGASLFAFLEAQDERFSVVVSGDLSHGHATTVNDPLYLPDPRWNMPVCDTIAKEFDSTIAEWVTSGNRNLLIEKSAGIVKEAMSCGFDGFLWLQGGIDSLKEKWTFRGQVLENLSPSYFGMMVATFS